MRNIRLFTLLIVIIGLFLGYLFRNPPKTNGQVKPVNNDAKIDVVLIDKFLLNTDKDEPKETLMTWEELNAHVAQMNQYIADHNMYSFKNVTPANPMSKQVTDAMKKSKTSIK